MNPFGFQSRYLPNTNSFSYPTYGTAGSAGAAMTTSPMSFADGIGAGSSLIGAGASLWNTYNQGKLNKQLLKEQKKARKLTEREYENRLKSQQQLQANFDSVWGA